MSGTLKRKASKAADSLKTQATQANYKRQTQPPSSSDETLFKSPTEQQKAAPTPLSTSKLSALVTRSNGMSSNAMPRTTALCQLDQLESLERTKQMEIIDSLRSLGVGNDISLPQVSLTSFP